MIEATYRIETETAGQRLDHYLVSQLPALSRSRIQELIKEEHIRLNGHGAKPSVKLRPGDEVSVAEPPPVVTETIAEAIALQVLYEDDDLIVIDKPPGMVVHPAAGNWHGTAVNALLHHCQSLSGIGGEQRPGIVHRLDKETSGCLVVAKNDFTHQALARQFAGREITKIYLALVRGVPRRKRGLLETPIGRHPIHRKRMAVLKEGKGRLASTSYRVLAEIGNDSLIECLLHTGRTHQIRVHMKHLGHPILGDELYGRRDAFSRQMLHAWKLGFSHPRSGERMNFQAPVPPDFLALGVSAHPV